MSEDRPKRPCSFFQQGRCKKGDECNFSHDVDGGEQRPRQSGPQLSGGDFVNLNRGEDRYRGNNRGGDRRGSNRDQPPREFNRDQQSRPQVTFDQDRQSENRRGGRYQGERNQNSNFNRNQQPPEDWNQGRQSDRGGFQRDNRDRDNRDNRDNRDRDTRKPNYTTQRQDPTPQVTLAPIPDFNAPILLLSFSHDQFIHFLPVIDADLIKLIGVVGARSIQFLPIQGDQFVNFSQKQELQLPSKEFDIQRAWIQRCYDQHVLMISIKRKSGNFMRSLLIYHNVLQTYQSTTIPDVCLMDITYCYLHAHQSLLYVFCQDNKIRIFNCYNNFILQECLDFTQPIQSVELLYLYNEDVHFLIGGNNGQLMSLKNQQLEKIHHNVVTGNIIDIRIDYANKRFFLLFQDDKASHVYILSESKDVIGPIDTLQGVKISHLICYQNYEGQNILAASNELGYTEFLLEDQEFKKVFHLPKKSAEVQPKIRDLKLLEVINQNQVIQKFILIGKDNPLKNIEVHYMIPQNK